MECLDYSTYVERRMSASGLSMPGSMFDTYDQMLGKLGQIAAIATLAPGATVGTVLGGAGTASGIGPFVGMMSAVGGMYYMSYFATTLFLAGVEGQYCRNTNRLNAALLANWMRSKGIYDTDGLEAEFIKHPELRIG